MSGTIKAIIGLISTAVILSLLLKNSKGFVADSGAVARGTTSFISALEGTK